MTKPLLSMLLFTFCVSGIYAQTIIVSGTVSDSDNVPMIGVNVIVKATLKGTQTDSDGNFSIDVDDKNATLVFSYVGYNDVEIDLKGRTEISVTLEGDVLLDEVFLVGSRNPKRTAVDTPVAVDIIDVTKTTTQIGKVEINEMLQYAAPSFNATKQSGADGADHIDPASLRGLGPDQTLVLINGKRRHQSSLVNLFGTRGRGNTGTDLNAIPSGAIKRIEILRDGASAQYGSDAIAGVINIVLKDDVDELSGSVSYGFYNANTGVDTGNFSKDNYGVWNTKGFRLDTERDGNAIGEDKNFDGGSSKVTANYGFKIADEGFANFTLEHVNKNKTLRPGFNFRKGFGSAAIEGFSFFGNSVIPVSDNTEMYAFGGRNYRDSDAFAFTRNPGDKRVVKSIYPDGFTPRITSIVLDNSISAGMRTKTESGWDIDINNTWGKNDFHYFIKGTLNATLVDRSPTEFDAGGHSLSQNTTSINVSKYYDSILKGVSIAFGSEYRTENFVIYPGEEGSYGTYDVDGRLFTDPNSQTLTSIPNPDPKSKGNIYRPGGSQGFPGYSPENQVDKNRNNLALYLDTEFDITEAFMLSAAARFENYSDFGSTLNSKIATRLKASEYLNIRGSLSTGFRAPSLAQIYYNLHYTNFVGGNLVETLLSGNHSNVTKSFGVKPLAQETALNGAMGFTSNFGNFTATLDGYYIAVKNRIVLTGEFPGDKIPDIDSVKFFVNGVNTETIGLDMVFSWKNNFGKTGLSATLLGNFNNMRITKVLNGDLDENNFFGARPKSYLLSSAPKSKVALNLSADVEWFNIAATFTRFGSIELIDYQALEPDSDYDSHEDKMEKAKDFYSPKFTTDLNLGFQLSKNFKLNVGSDNIFNVYPDQQNNWTGSGGYWDSVQMGFSGAYYYAKMNYNF